MTAINRLLGARRCLDAEVAAVVVPPSGPTEDGLLQEDGTSFILTEDGDYIIEE